MLYVLLTAAYPCSSADPCARIDCGAHGSCSGGTCTCESGAYTGDRCQIFDACFGIDCGAHGTCSQGSCICEDDAAVYTGQRCDTCVWLGDEKTGACYGEHSLACCFQKRWLTPRIATLADPTVYSCGNIHAVEPKDAVEFDCTGARYDIAQSPAAIVCVSEGCSLRECCTTLRPTCGDTQADGRATVFDCSLAQKYLGHHPTQIYCEERGCSMLECCNADTEALVPPPTSTDLSCTNMHELQDLLESVSSVCCDGECGTETGYPASCDAACARQLLPTQVACGEFLAQPMMAPMKQALDSAAALCDDTAQTCSSMDEFQGLMDEVSAECCDEPTEDCSSGYPASCNAGCAARLVPMRRVRFAIANLPRSRRPARVPPPSRRRIRARR